MFNGQKCLKDPQHKYMSEQLPLLPYSPYLAPHVLFALDKHNNIMLLISALFNDWKVKKKLLQEKNQQQKKNQPYIILHPENPGRTYLTYTPYMLEKSFFHFFLPQNRAGRGGRGGN